MGRVVRSPSSLTRSQSRTFSDLTNQLACVDAAETSVLTTVMPQLRKLFGGDLSLAYGASPGKNGWMLDQFVGDGELTSPLREKLAALLARAKSSFCVVDFLRPQPQARNRAMSVLASYSLQQRMSTSVWRDGIVPLGLQCHDQLVIMVCDGPALLAYFGVFRPSPFRDHEVATMRALVTPVRRRLKLEQSALQSRLYRLGLQAALDALPAPAFVCRQNGDIEVANETGQILLRKSFFNARQRIRRCLEADAVTTVSVRGLPAYSIVVLPADDVRDRSAYAAQRWKLTRRQRDVLELVIAGDTNKEIAAKLQCAEVTVELHVTGLLHKAGVSNRATLISRFFRCP